MKGRGSTYQVHYEVQFAHNDPLESTLIFVDLSKLDHAMGWYVILQSRDLDLLRILSLGLGGLLMG